MDENKEIRLLEQLIIYKRNSVCDLVGDIKDKEAGELLPILKDIKKDIDNLILLEKMYLDA